MTCPEAETTTTVVEFTVNKARWAKIVGQRFMFGSFKHNSRIETRKPKGVYDDPKK